MDVLTFSPIISHAAIYGLILSGILFTLILGVTRINPEIMLKDYPPDIQSKYGPMSERTKRQRIPVAIVTLLVFVSIVTLSFQSVGIASRGDISFFTAFLHLFVMFFVFNLLDWLILDWLIVVAIRPSFIVLPGTEGMAGYKDYGFHFRDFLIGMLIISLASLLVAGIVAVLF